MNGIVLNVNKVTVIPDFFQADCCGFESRPPLHVIAAQGLRGLGLFSFFSHSTWTSITVGTPPILTASHTVQ